jgi:hypothetical protein
MTFIYQTSPSNIPENQSDEETESYICKIKNELSKLNKTGEFYISLRSICTSNIISITPESISGLSIQKEIIDFEAVTLILVYYNNQTSKSNRMKRTSVMIEKCHAEAKLGIIPNPRPDRIIFSQLITVGPSPLNIITGNLSDEWKSSTETYKMGVLIDIIGLYIHRFAHPLNYYEKDIATWWPKRIVVTQVLDRIAQLLLLYIAFKQTSNNLNFRNMVFNGYLNMYSVYCDCDYNFVKRIAQIYPEFENYNTKTLLIDKIRCNLLSIEQLVNDSKSNICQNNENYWRFNLIGRVLIEELCTTFDNVTREILSKIALINN